MKKTKLIIVAIIILLSVSVGMLTACEVPVDHEQGFKLMKENYEKSITYQIYYAKELVSDNKNPEITRVNSVCDIDKKNNYSMNADGTYVNHGVHVYNEKAGQLQQEIYVGLSKDGKKDPGKNLKMVTTFTGLNADKVATYSKTYSPMTASEYIKSTEFEKYTLTSKFAEIGRLKREDMIFDEKKGVTRTGELTNLKFKLTEEYYNSYRTEFGKESILKGTYVTMELLFGRIANITVMQEEAGTESIFGVSEYECYKIEVAYLGPKLNVPNYNALDADKNKVWTSQE